MNVAKRPTAFLLLLRGQSPGRNAAEWEERKRRKAVPHCFYTSPRNQKLSILIKMYSLKSCAINTERCIERAYLTNLRNKGRTKQNAKYLFLYLHVSSFSFLYPQESSKHYFHTWMWLRMIFLKLDEFLHRNISHVQSIFTYRLDGISRTSA